MSKFTVSIVEGWLQQMTADEARGVMSLARDRVKQLEKIVEDDRYGALFDGLKAIPWQRKRATSPWMYMMESIVIGGAMHEKLQFQSYQPRAKRLWFWHPKTGYKFHINERQIKRHQPSRTEAEVRRRLRDR